MTANRVMPLNEKQLAQLTQKIDITTKPFRILANGCAVNITTGICSKKGSNVMYHPVYWDRPKTFIKQVKRFMKENNPSVTFRITYH